MSEAVIIQSPHAFVPKKCYTEQEREEMYRTRIDESFKPYTVIDVLTKVYHRSFADDLKQFIGKHPGRFQKKEKDGRDWAVSNIWVNECRVIRPESIFNQPLNDFLVDIFVQTRIRIEEVVPGKNNLRRNYNIKPELRLRYCFNLVPCHLTCVFETVILNEKNALRNVEGAIPADKYLLPVLTDADYIAIAACIRKNYYPKSYGKDVPIDPAVWVRAMKSTIFEGVFPEEGALGEYFFSFGTAVIIDPETGEPRKRDINPGTVIINRELADKPGQRNSTVAHEGAHKYFATAYFMLQKTHGHEYCSYMCKRYSDPAASHDRWTPVDIMEMHANKFPGYLMIEQTNGNDHARRLLAYYGGIRNLENMRRLIDEMAEYYGTTKKMAQTRLVDFGFTEARGIMQSVDGKLIPSYLSNLKDNETYTISEEEGIREYLRNEKFRAVIDSGLYVYAEGHYCLNHPEYVFTDRFGITHLKSSARENMAACCLVFRYEYDNALTRVFNGVLRKGVGRGRKDIKYVGRNGESPLTAEGLALRKQIEKQRAETGMLLMNFNQMTVHLMKQKKVTIQKLADETGLSEETIKNLRNDSTRVFQISEIVAFCIGLHLPPDVSGEYIRTGPSKFLDTTDMALYRYALEMWWKLPVPAVNRKLVEAGARPLTNLVDGYDENGMKMA